MKKDLILKKEDKNILQFFEESSFFLQKDDDFREENCRKFWKHLIDNIGLIKFAVNKFEELTDKDLEELQGNRISEFKMAAGTSIYLKSIPVLIQDIESVPNHVNPDCHYVQIEDTYRRFSYLMYLADTSHLKIKDSLIHHINRVIIKELEIQNLKDSNSRFYIRIYGGLAEENRKAFEELDFSKIKGDALKHETFAKAEPPSGFEDSILNKITYPYIGSIIVPNNIVTEVERIFREKNFKIKKK